MSQQATADVQSDGLPVKIGAAVGFGAFFVGYILTYVLATIDSDIDFGGEEHTMELIGLLFYNSHFVDAELSLAGESEAVNLLSEESTQIPELVYNLVPVLVLIGAGYLVASRAAALATDGDAAKAGATVVIGYLPAAAVGTAIFEISEGEEMFRLTAAPDFTMAIVLAGLAFPLVLGAVGGYIARQS